MWRKGEEWGVGKRNLGFCYAMAFCKQFCDGVAEKEVDIKTENGTSSKAEESETSLGFVPVILTTKNEGQTITIRIMSGKGEHVEYRRYTKLYMRAIILLSIWEHIF
jgi:hypothetical protein